MQRFSATNVGGGVGNAIGGVSARDSARADSSFASSNFTLNSRRQVQITPYKLKCDRESLSARLGPPDFYPQASNCPEETLTNDYANHGYREIAEGIEESKEILLTQHGFIDETRILKCKEAIRKCLRAINESRTHKRKAGQVYEVPLSGQLLLKPGIFPEQKPCTEDFRKKWIEGLSQQHKRLRSLADHVPHGYRRKALFEVLIKHNVPLLRATWFIKITYLNQVRPASTSVSSGSPDKSLVTRTELWTRDAIDYLQLLLDEFSSKENYISNQHGRDPSSQVSFSNALQRKDDTQAILVDCEEPALQFKWWYMVRLLQWHLAEGLVLSSHIIEWVLKQLQEKESIEVLQLLLPIIFDVVESIMICQTHVRSLVDLAVRNINYLSSSDSHIPDDFNKSYFMSALVELVRFLLVSVPDTFVALDCFPLPLSAVPDGANPMKTFRTDFDRIQYVPDEIMNNRTISFGYIASSVQKRASSLATAVNPGLEGCNVAQVVQSLDRSLIEGDIRAAYSSLFENPCHGRVDEGWIAEVSPYLRSSLKWIGTVSFSVLHSVFLLCEWAACDYRDSRTKSSLIPNFSGRKDFSQVYVAVQLLNLWVESTKSLNNNKNVSMMGSGNVINGFTSCDGVSGGSSLENVSSGSKSYLKSSARVVDSDILQSPGPMHDIIVCWLDLHEPSKSEGFKRLYMLVLELIRVGIFHPQAYVRQLIVSGILDYGETFHEMSKKRRHNRILKQLPGPLLLEAFEEAKIADVALLRTVVNIYSNERRLLLQKRLVGKHIYLSNGDSVNGYTGNVDNAAKKHAKLKADVAEVRTAISIFLNLSSSTLISTDSQIDMAQSYTLKRSISSTGIAEGTAGCEECLRSKKQKVNEDKSSHLQVLSPNPSDDEDIWWVRKGTLKSLDSSFKIDPPKLAKHAPRGRQKNVRKTQSLAQLAAARLEGSQGASTSHVCDNKVSCPHHRPVVDGEGSKFMDGLRPSHDLVALGKTLKQLRLLEKRSVTRWLISTVKNLLDGVERTSAKVGHFGGSYSSAVDERSSIRWKLSEDELSIILYLLDISYDFQLAVKFLLWLLPKTSVGPLSSIPGGGNHSMLPKNAETRVLDVGEPFVLSAIRRYENILIATDLLPEYLTAAMNRSVSVMASSGRASSSAAFIYARNVLKRFGCISSVVKWEKNFKVTCDQRLLAELETGRALDSELGFSLIGFPAGVEDVDDYFRQKITSKLSRAGPIMKEIVQRQIEEVWLYYLGKERKVFSAVNATAKSTSAEKLDDGFQIAQQITFGLLGCIRQNTGGAQDVDPSLVAAAVSAIIGNVGSAIAKMPDFSLNSTFTANFSSNMTASSCARRILSIHISCLSLLKDALGDRQSRVFEIAIATEAFSIVAAALASGKSQARNQYQLSPENHDSNTNISNEILSNSTKAYLGRAVKAAAAVSALVIGAVVCGITNLERMVSCFKLKEGLDVLQFIRGMRSSSNGVSRSAGAYKVDNGIEAYVHWFRVLIGNCRTVFDGLLIELLGDHYIMALSRMQRVLPINLAFPPAYSIFGMAIWRTYIFNSNISMREDNHLYHSIILAINEAVKHQPFRDVCLRDSHAFYEHLTTDVSDAEFAAMLENHSSEKHLKMMAFVPLRARLFLNAVLDSKMPKSVVGQDDGARIPGHSEAKSYVENETRLLDQLVHVLDTLQPAKFHWQWIELRLLLNEQVLMEKIETHNMSLVEAIRSLSPNSDNFALSDNENNFMEIVLTRLLVRPDAASLYSEVVHLLGRSLEESLLKHAKWLLAGNDVLLGRKTIRQRLVNVAQLRGLSTRAKFWKPWGWSNSVEARGDKRKVEVSAIEEGEVVEDGMDFKRSGKPGLQVHDPEGHSSQLYVTEKALVELVLPCIDRSSGDSRNTFASDLIKQLNTIEQYVSGFTRGTNKQAGVGSSGVEVVSTKSGVRSKSMRGGSPGMGRRAQVVADLPPSAAGLRASMWLRLQFLLRLLPVIYVDRESSARNMRHMLASVLLRLLGNRVVYEDSDLSVYSNLARKGEADSDFSLSPSPSGDSLFDRFLCVLHGLLSRHKPVWMKFPKSHMKSTDKFPRDFPILDREVAESLQAELDRMQLPTAIRRRIQTVMPVLPPLLSLSISSKAPTVTLSALSMMQPCTSVTGSQHNSSQPPRSPPVSSSRHPITNASSKGKSIPQQEVELEIDPWLLLEDGTACGPTPGAGGASVGGDNANLKASNWLKGAVRVRRTDLSYIGPVDDDT